MVWDIFRTEFPSVVEHSKLMPQFETFGGPNDGRLNIEFGAPPIGSRLWFISDDENHLLQFQDDRLLLNWRRRPGASNTYPRYERISANFESFLGALSGLFEREFNSPLAVNQAEITYINTIPIDSGDLISDWLSFLSLDGTSLESLNLSFSQVLEGGEGNLARMFCELQTGRTADNQNGLRLAFTVRGAPAANEIGATMRFLRMGRANILRRFVELTTAKAQASWGRQL